MKPSTTIASAAVAGILGLAGVSVAGAAANPGSPPPTSARATGATTTTAANPSPTTTSSPSTVAPTPGGAKVPGAAAGTRATRRRHRRRQAAAIIERTIEITPRVLGQELRGGQTIAQIATDHGVQPQAVIDALEGAANKRIDAALSAGKITSERAARLKQRVATAVPRIVNDWHPRQHAAG